MSIIDKLEPPRNSRLKSMDEVEKEVDSKMGDEQLKKSFGSKPKECAEHNKKSLEDFIEIIIRLPKS